MRYSTSLLYLAVLSLPIFCSQVDAAPVKGRLTSESPASYKVVAVNRDGISKVASIQSDGKFSINVKRNTSLHLVNTSGKYFGPIGAAQKTSFYLSLSGQRGNIGKVALGSSFGKVKYNGRMKKLFNKSKVSFDPELGPLGAGKFGLVLNPIEELVDARSENFGIANTDENQVGEDLDKDGLPDLLDIDDDGDLQLDIVDPVEHAIAEFNAEITSTLRLDLASSLNFNIGSASDDQIDSLIQNNLFLLFLLQSSGDATVSSVNVDCGALSYCSSTGTATIQMDSPPIANGALWSQYDPEEDGQPNLFVTAGRMPEINVKPRATRTQIGTGDTIFFRIVTSEGSQVLPAVLPFVFATVPALHSYASQGAQAQEVVYPVDSVSGLGTRDNPISLSSSQVTLTLWKPQRVAIAGAEQTGYIDMGGLNYGVYLSPQNGTSSPPLTCQGAEYSVPSGSLQARSDVNGAQALVDTAADTPADRENRVSFALDIGTCLSRQGISTSGLTVMMDLVATSQAQDQTSQSVYFRLP